MNVTEMTNQELILLKNELETEVSINHNMQMAKKVLL